jgi:pyruvate formate-lyase activating enzyme-like uncharacterized protein
MTNKEKAMQDVRNSVGWAYDDIRWITSNEAADAKMERDRLLGFLRDKARFSFSGTKPHTGPLSQGCQLCGEGSWSCLFINQLCTADCFFCPQDRKLLAEKPPIAAQNLAFTSPENYAEFIAHLGYKGVGFSGGESLLAFDDLKSHIKKLRERFRDNLYIWIYTNGDLAEKERLIELRECGLNEIRFNISAREYELASVERALGIIDIVTIEIPAIPEDFKTVRQLMTRMQKMGVSHLNLHQLLATRYNYKNFIGRHYTFLHQPSVTILESEMTALRLMEHAITKGIPLPINYCSSFFKSEFQTRGNRMRVSSLAKEDDEELTETGHIRRMELRGGDSGRPPTSIRSHALRTLNHTKLNLRISYFEPSLKIAPASAPTDHSRSQPFPDRILVDKKLSHQLELEGADEIGGFFRLVLDKEDEAKVRRALLENYCLNTRDDLKGMMETIDKIIAVKKFEHVGTGFAEIY